MVINFPTYPFINAGPTKIKMPPDYADQLISLLPNLRRFGVSLSRNGDVAEELVQITVERAISGWRGYDRNMRLEPWLFRIMRNAFIDMTRRNKVRGAQIDVSDNPDVLTQDPRGAIEAKLVLDATKRAISDLPVEHQQVLQLVCISDLSYAEAADVLGIPKGTIMSRLSRARLALASKLGIK